MSGNHLRISQLSKTYANSVRALSSVNLEITNGMFGLLGPNGAGKSTLMRTIATLQEPDEGTILFNGTDIVQEPEALRQVLGYLPQEFGVYPRIAAQALLDHIAVLKGITDKTSRREQVEAILVQTNLFQHRHKAVHTYSGGMRQRFGIAQALLGSPKLIIVDEPTAGLDPEERNRFLNLLSEIGENIIVMLSTHIVEDVRDLCPQMAIMAAGQIIAQGNPEALCSTLSGQLWQKTITKAELPIYQSAFQLISTRLYAGQTQIQILADKQPDKGFEAIKPDLESVYFSTLLRS